MSYAMCLDNSWDVMCEEEMYDVNGGSSFSLLRLGRNLGYIGGAVAGIAFIGKYLASPFKAMAAYIAKTKVWASIVRFCAPKLSAAMTKISVVTTNPVFMAVVCVIAAVGTASALYWLGCNNLF